MTRLSPTIESGCEVIKEYTNSLTRKPGVYRMLDKNEQILYIGKAKNLYNRVKSYTNPNNHSYRIKKMISETKSMEFIITNSEAEALLLEANLIKKNKPRYNIAMRDDKSFPKILINKEHAFPRIMKYRGNNKIKGDYFGPFSSAGAVNKTIDILQKAFLLRTCSDNVYANRSRPCLLYQINRCSAPCTKEISEEEYSQLVEELKEFMSGKASDIKSKIYSEMNNESKNFNFENAALLRDRLEAISKIQSQQMIQIKGMKDADIFAVCQKNNTTCIQVFFIRSGQNWGNREYYPITNKIDSNKLILESFLAQFYVTHPCPKNILISEKIDNVDLLTKALSERNSRKVIISIPTKGQKYKFVQKVLLNAEEALNRKVSNIQNQKNLMKGLQEKLKLKEMPRRVEIYDNSHIQGSLAVGGMVVMGNEGFEKKHYRKFNIKSNIINKGDDYAMMREVLSRRFSKFEINEVPENKPNLIIIDGGIGQLNIASQILKEYNFSDIELISISKDKNRRFGGEKIHILGSKPMKLDNNDPILHFIQRMRDEAHRFAIGSHRIRRKMHIKDSKLDSIQGVGAKRKKELLQYFGSVKSIQDAAIDDIIKVPGINNRIAEEIYLNFHDSLE
tara:strand:- start:13171 stop:15030 length:1860 start_codon:yes stop_codon:yes gene_type:complete